MAALALGVLSNCIVATGCTDHVQQLEDLGRILLETLVTMQPSALGLEPFSVLLSSLVKVARHTDVAKVARNTLVSLLPMFTCKYVSM